MNSTGKSTNTTWEMLKATASDWSEDNASRLAAALAFYTLLSLAPLLVIAVSVAGLVFGDEAARGQIAQQIAGLVGPEAGKAIEEVLARANSEPAAPDPAGPALDVTRGHGTPSRAAPVSLGEV